MKRLVGMLALVALVALPPLSARAGGSFPVCDLWPILQQQPAIAGWVEDSLELDESGMAMRIGQEVNPDLGGLRVGPYVILARPKGADGPFTLELTIETQLDWIDDAGNAVDLEKATAVRETFDSLTLRPSPE